MVEQIVLADCNIVFDLDGFNIWEIPHTIAQVGQHNDSSLTNGDVGHASNGLGGDINQRDAVQKITDELWKTPLWWILEFLPLSHTYEDEKDKWVTTLW